MSDANAFFASDDWQPADWLQALDRLAPAPAPEPIPASSKVLDTMPNVPILEWHACASGQPSVFGWYAVADARGNVYAARWTDNPYASSERARKPRWVSAHGRIDTNVAYWHPMPPAPAIEVQA